MWLLALLAGPGLGEGAEEVLWLRSCFVFGSGYASKHLCCSFFLLERQRELCDYFTVNGQKAKWGDSGS